MDRRSKIEYIKSTKLLRPADAIIFAAVIVAALLLLLLLPRGGGQTVNVYSDGKLVFSLPLDGDVRREVRTDYGMNVVEISDGKVRVMSADCPDGVCVLVGSIGDAGESIICLPNRLVVEISGDGDFDGVVG